MKQLFRLIQWFRKNPIIVLFVMIIVFFSSLSSSFLTVQNFLNILVQASALIIVATGMTFVLLTAGIDLSVGSIMFLAGVISGKLVVSGFSLWVAIPIIFLIGLLYGLLNGWAFIRFKITPFIVTLATLYIGRGFGLYLSDTRAVNLPDTFLNISSYKVFGIPMPVIIMLVVLLLFHLVLTYTRFGRQIYAIGHDSTKAMKAGINVNGLLLKVYLISGFCAALGGAIAIAQLGAISPSFGLQYEFLAIAAAVLGGTSLFGGRGKLLPGTFIGAILIQMIQNGLVIINADPYIYPLVTSTIIFLIVMVDTLRHFHWLPSFNKTKKT